MRLIDISHGLSAETPVYPGDLGTALTRYKTLKEDGHNAYVLESDLHTGTHVDAPMHLTNDLRFLSDFPPEHFIGEGLILDVRGESPITLKPQYREMVSRGSIVLLYTGFGARFGEASYFSEYPAVDEKLAEFLISRNIKMIGMDTPSPDYPPFPIHKRFLSGGVFILENLTNLESLLNAEKFEVIALPLKITAEASFARAVCRVIE